jgi:hypothetical protein
MDAEDGGETGSRMVCIYHVSMFCVSNIPVGLAVLRIQSCKIGHEERNNWYINGIDGSRPQLRPNLINSILRIIDHRSNSFLLVSDLVPPMLQQEYTLSRH